MIPKLSVFAVGFLLLCSPAALAKDAGDLLAQYLANAATAVKDEELALVEIISVADDAKPEDNWKRTGTLELKIIESTGKRLPKKFTVRFYKRAEPGEDAWTWDGVSPEKGQRLLGFFNKWDGMWAVRKDGRHNVVNNPENIEPALLAKAQKLFKTQLTAKKKQDRGTHKETEKQPRRPRKLARILDPSPELRRELYALDNYRHGSEEKFARLERKADELLKRYTARDDQARICFEVAHVAAQSDIRKHVKRVRKYARKSLALSRDPLQRAWLYSYLGSAAEVEAEKTFADRRRQAAKELLTGYAEMLAQELPAKAPELFAVDKLGDEGNDPVEAARARARHAAQMARRQEAAFIGELVHRRDTLANQLRWLYHPDPRIHGRNPDGPQELRALAGKVLNDPKAVKALLARVTAQ